MTNPIPPLDPRGTVLGDEVYALIGEAILDGRLPAGERLRDQELAEFLGVSRTPVREALQRLEVTGLVEVAPNRYTRVSSPDDKSRADMHEFIGYLMGNVVRLAVARCDDDTLADLVVLADDMVATSCTSDDQALAHASIVFFTRLTRVAGNRAILRFMREAELVIRRTLASWHPFIECPLGRTAAYEQFRDALAARDSARAEALLRAINGLV